MDSLRFWCVVISLFALCQCLIMLLPCDTGSRVQARLNQREWQHGGGKILVVNSSFGALVQGADCAYGAELLGELGRLEAPPGTEVMPREPKGAVGLDEMHTMAGVDWKRKAWGRDVRHLRAIQDIGITTYLTRASARSTTNWFDMGKLAVDIIGHLGGWLQARRPSQLSCHPLALTKTGISIQVVCQLRAIASRPFLSRNSERL
jgi:hypothetical protein